VIEKRTKTHHKKMNKRRRNDEVCGCETAKAQSAAEIFLMYMVASRSTNPNLFEFFDREIMLLCIRQQQRLIILCEMALQSDINFYRKVCS